MNFIISDLSVLAYANNFTLWHYTTQDQSVEEDDYFNNAVAMLRINDMIICNINTDKAPVTVIYIVTQNDGKNVTIKRYS